MPRGTDRCRGPIGPSHRGRRGQRLRLDLSDATVQLENEVDLVLLDENIGFARACNLAVSRRAGTHLVLVNSDAVAAPGALDALLACFQQDPGRGIVGGRTLTPDGPDPASCFAAPSLWSWWLDAIGLSTAFRGSRVWDPESLGQWKRDSVAEVGVVSGCLLLTSYAIWQELDGFDGDYFMYAEDADLCRRASVAGYRPTITPASTVVHASGASSGSRTDQRQLMLTGRATYARKRWGGWRARVGITLLRLSVATRVVGERLDVHRGRAAVSWAELWRRRDTWSVGWPEVSEPSPTPPLPGGGTGQAR